jgi:hypothetical protein
LELRSPSRTLCSAPRNVEGAPAPRLEEPMAAQRHDPRHEPTRDLRLAPAAGAPPVPDGGLDAARGIGWGLLLAVGGFWGPMLVLTWKWLHR